MKTMVDVLAYEAGERAGYRKAMKKIEAVVQQERERWGVFAEHEPSHPIFRVSFLRSIAPHSWSCAVSWSTDRPNGHGEGRSMAEAFENAIHQKIEDANLD